MVIDDLSLERTTNGHGPVFAAGVEELRALDADSWFSAAYAGEQVPELSEVLALSDVQFELELKGYGESFVDDVLDAVRAVRDDRDVLVVMSMIPMGRFGSRVLRCCASCPTVSIGWSPFVGRRVR